MPFTPTARGGPPDCVLPRSTPCRRTGTMMAQQVSSPHEFLRYHRPILNETVTQGSHLSLRATGNGIACVVDQLERKVKEIAKETSDMEEDIEKLEEDVKGKNAELGALEEMIEVWAKKQSWIRRWRNL